MNDQAFPTPRGVPLENMVPGRMYAVKRHEGETFAGSYCGAVFRRGRPVMVQFMVCGGRVKTLSFDTVERIEAMVAANQDEPGATA